MRCGRAASYLIGHQRDLPGASTACRGAAPTCARPRRRRASAGQRLASDRRRRCAPHRLAATPAPPVATGARCGRRRMRAALHLGHDRPAEGLLLTARAVLPGGACTAAALLGLQRRRDPAHAAAADPHQRAERLLPGAAHRLDARGREALFRLRVLELAGASSGATVTYLLGVMLAMLLSRIAREHDKAHRVRSARRPACAAVPCRRSRNASACRCSKATARPKPTSSSARDHGEQRPRHVGKRASPDSKRGSSTTKTTKLPRDEPGELLVRASEPFAFATGYFGMNDKTVEAWRQLVPHRRPRASRRRRQLLLRRPDEERDPPQRREHLGVRGRAGRC